MTLYLSLLRCNTFDCKCNVVCRCMGYFIRHIHNRDLAAENIATAYLRLRVLLSCAPSSIAELQRRVIDAGLGMPPHQNSLLRVASQHVQIRGDVVGEFGVSLKLHRRYGREREKTHPITFEARRMEVIGSRLCPSFRMDVTKPFWEIHSGVRINGVPNAVFALFLSFFCCFLSYYVVIKLLFIITLFVTFRRCFLRCF